MEKNCNKNCKCCGMCLKSDENTYKRDYGKTIKISIMMMIIFGIATMLSILLMISVIILAIYNNGYLNLF